MLPLGCWSLVVYYMETGPNNAWMLDLSTVYYMETGLNNAFYVATWMLDLPELGKYSVLYGNRA